MAKGFVVSVVLLAFYEVITASVTSSESQILSMIKDLQQRVTIQEKAIHSLRSHIAKQDDVISSLQEQEQRQNDLISTLQKQLQLHDEHFSNSSDINIAVVNKLCEKSQLQKEHITKQHGQAKMIRDQEQQSDHLGKTQSKRHVVDEEEPVAFQAVVSADTIEHIQIHEKIVFDSVRLNLDRDYNSVNGVFVAPRPGIYLFSTSVLTEPNCSLDVNIVKNGTPLAGAFANTEGKLWYDQGSVTVAAELNAGDEVWVENTWPADAKVRGHGSHTSFSGVLVMGM
ncbi:cerebellin-1-like [Mercenaria mercenaria]|uniref:cerebellin-1-like n=1 Tax=Mercenaria mercenaria TaxID=6596 RepID=UPI00234E437A|nr:cerebellin-1-like [Mercenaria mercenaria]